MPEPHGLQHEWKQLVRQALSGTSLSPERETEIVEELAQHLADRFQELVSSGKSAEEAHAIVEREIAGHDLIQQLGRLEQPGTEAPAFGNPVRASFFSGLLYDLRYAARLLRLNPTFTVVAIISLALGIGANTAMFQLIDAIQLRTLPVKDPQQLALIKIDTKNKGRTGEVHGPGAMNTFAQWEQVRDRSQAFSAMAAWGGAMFNLNPGGEVHNVAGIFVTGDFFNLLGVSPIAGRLLNPSDDIRGCGSPGVVISYPLWRGQFAQDAAIVGKKITLEGHPFTIIGVTEPDFFGLDVGSQFDIAVPACAEAIFRPERSALVNSDVWWLTIVGRLKPGWTIEKASAQLQAISPLVFRETLPTQYTAEDTTNYLNFGLTAIPGDTGVSALRRAYSTPLSLLLSITGLVLLIACANLANLLLARASAREREIAIRLALGAARGRLIRQLLTESFLISALGAVAGILIAHNVTRLIIRFLSTQDHPIVIDLSPDLRLFAFTVLVTVVVCLLFGLAPALRSSNAAPSRAMNAGGRSVISGRERNGLRRALVITQISLSLVLVTCALLFVRSFNHLVNMDPGFDRHQVLVANMDFSSLNLSPEQRQLRKERMLQSIRGLPGVESAAQTNIVPISHNGWNENIFVSGEKKGLSNFMRTSPGYLATMKTPILLGRDFDPRDTATSPKVAIVNQLFAEKILQNANPIGMNFTVQSYSNKQPVIYQVIGLARNSVYSDLRDDLEPQVFVSALQDDEPDAFPSYVIRTSLPMQAITAEVKDTVLRDAPTVALDFRVLATQVEESLARERMLAALSGFFGILAGVLAVVGIYGVISYMVVRRTSEIGIRMALGATRTDILRLIMREAGVLLGIGLATGTALTFVAARAAASLLYGLKPTDMLTYAGAIVSLTCVTIAASLLPAQRASRLDPMVALRDE